MSARENAEKLIDDVDTGLDEFGRGQRNHAGEPIDPIITATQAQAMATLALADAVEALRKTIVRQTQLSGTFAAAALTPNQMATASTALDVLNALNGDGS